MDKLKFWKHEEPLPELPPLSPAPSLDPSPQLSGVSEPPSSEPFPDFPRPNISPPSQPRAFESMQQPRQQTDVENQLQLISAKLDTVKAQLDTVLQHLNKERWP